MGVSVRVQPIERDVAVLIDENLSPKAQSKFLAVYAREQRDDAIVVNERAMGSVPKYETFVDGRLGANLESVKPTGHIVFEFELLHEMFAWIGAELVQHSPVGGPPSPAYAASHVFFADGEQVAPGGPVPLASTYTFANTVPYARKIERGESAQAPDGVYQAVAAMAQARFGNLAKIRFTYVSLAGSKGERQPAIVITAR